MVAEATILIPTHNHARTLYASVGSALAQSVENIEVFIVGDGVTSETREVVKDLMKDKRIRFFDNEKGPRNGEILRHAALFHATGKIVSYLADDDLYFANHIEVMLELLADADFANALPVRIYNGIIDVLPADLSVKGLRDLMVTGFIHLIPLTCGAHTLEFYRRLPQGWRTTPKEKSTEYHMWQQFLTQPACRAVSSKVCTVLTFPSMFRKGMSNGARCAELAEWQPRLTDDTFRRELEAQMFSISLTTGANELVRNINIFKEQLDESRKSVEQWKDKCDAQTTAAKEWQAKYAELASRQRSKSIWKV